MSSCPLIDVGNFSLECYSVGVVHAHELMIQELEGARLTLALQTGRMNQVKREAEMDPGC